MSVEKQRTRFVGVRLPEELLARIDQEALALGERRSLALRTLLRRGLALADAERAAGATTRAA